MMEEIKIEKYIGKSPYRHPAYPLTCKMAAEIKIHSDGEFPKTLIGERRPGESDTIKKYREAIYKSKTKGAFGKVLTELGKIRKAEGWYVKYDEKSLTSGREGERLNDYCEKNFPLDFNSVTNWAFNVLLKNYVVDPNSVILVMPLEQTVEEADYYKPYPFVFNSDQVWDFMPGEYAVLRSQNTSTYKTKGGQVKDGLILYAVTAQSITRYEQIDEKGAMMAGEPFEHGLGYLPAFMIGAQFFKVYERHFIFESRIINCIPSWDEAVREYSDLQAEVVQHIHSLMWSYTNQDCKKCHSTGTVTTKGKEGQIISSQCETCKGTGYIPFNPYEHISLRPNSATEQALPNPFVGYVTKDTKIVEIQDKRVKAHIFDGLAAINMEFLADVPLSESGVSKEVDRDSLNTFVASIAEDIVRVIDRVYKMINDYRYANVDKDKREKQLPKIPVPQKFDLISSNYILQELTSAKNAKVNPSIVSALEIDYANAKFNADDKTKDFMVNIYILNPLAGVAEDDKVLQLQNGGITEKDYIISCNIASFVKMAMNADAEFAAKSYEEKAKTIAGYADAIIKANSEKQEVMNDVA